MAMMKRLLAMLLMLCMLLPLAVAEDAADGFEDSIVIDGNDAQSGEDDVYIPEDDADLTATIEILDEERDESVDPDSLDLNENLPDDVVNILLIGIDGRTDDIDSGTQHGDVQIIVSINKKDGTIKLTSVLRDLYVALSLQMGNGDHNSNIVDDLAGEHVVGVVVMEAVGEDHVSLAVTNQVNESQTDFLGLIEHLIIVVQADVLSTDQRCGVGCFLLADGCDLFHSMGSRTNITGGSGCDINLVTLGSVLCQSTGAHGFDVIGMGANCQNIHNQFSFCKFWKKGVGEFRPRPFCV